MEVEDARENQLLGEEPEASSPQNPAPREEEPRQVELPQPAQPQGLGVLTKTQRKNRQARLKRKQRLQQAAVVLAVSEPARVTAAVPEAAAAALAVPEAGMPRVAVAPVVAAPAQPLAVARGPRPHVRPPPGLRQHHARHVPRSVFATAWGEMLKAKRSLDVAMELLKFYRYDG